MASIDLNETYDYPEATTRSSKIAGYNQFGAAYNSQGGAVYGPGPGNIGTAPIMRDLSSRSVSAPSSRSYGSTGSQTKTPSRVGSQTSTTKAIAPGGGMPEFGDIPAIDEARIKRLTQTRSAAGQRALRGALRESMTQASYQDNPNVAAMINKKAMEGFGQGIAETYTKAQQQATAEEARDRGMQMQKQSAVFNAAMTDYMKRFGTEQTTKYDYVNPNAPGGTQSDNPLQANYITPAHAARNEMMAGTYKG